MRSLAHTLATIVRDLRRELARLNSAGLGTDGLRALTRRQRMRAAKSVLHDRHSGAHRCC